jgi:hypothetical protein
VRVRRADFSGMSVPSCRRETQLFCLGGDLRFCDVVGFTRHQGLHSLPGVYGLGTLHSGAGAVPASDVDQPRSARDAL